MISYTTLILGELESNCYLVWDTVSRECVIIDPADEGVEMAEEINRRQLKAVGILATHGHLDHILGALDLKLILQIPFYLHKSDTFLVDSLKKRANYWLKQKIVQPQLTIDVDLQTTTEIKLGEEIIEVLPTPGHTPGSVSFYLPQAKLVLVGDTLFADGVGRTDLSYSSKEDFKKSLQKLSQLPAETLVLPGHGREFFIDRRQKYDE